MSVFLSPVGGAGAQFFDNNGTPLSGGKLYTYAAGTTTPAVTYTNSGGNTEHTNPIVLDAAGRVSAGGEIWLADNVIYKFVLKTSNDVLLATWDNITGVNSNFVSYTAETEVQTATAGQTVFNLNSVTYQPGTGNLTVFVDGVNQYEGTSYVETDSNTVTFTDGLHVGALVKFTTATQVTGNATNAAVVAYDPPFDNAVSTTVEEKLSYYINVKDFGAVGDGATDSTTAIQNALDYAVGLANGGYSVTLDGQNGEYLISDPVEIATLSDGLLIQNLKLIADAAFDGSRYLFEGGIGNASGLSLRLLKFDNCYFDSKHVCGGIRLQNHFRFEMTRCVVRGYATTGLFLDYGHQALEGLVAQCFFFEYDTGETGYLDIANYSGLALYNTATDFFFTDNVFAFSLRNIYVASASNHFTNCHSYAGIEYAVYLDGSASAARNTFTSCWLNGYTVLQNANDRCSNSFVGCLFKHDDVWQNNGGDPQYTIIQLRSDTVGAELQPLTIVGCTFDGESAAVGGNYSLQVSGTGTFTSAQHVYFSNNIFQNGISELRHAAVSGLTVMASGDYDSDGDRVSYGERAGGLRDGYFKTVRENGTMIHDVGGADVSLPAGTRWWDTDAGVPTYWAAFFKSTGRLSFEKRVDTTYSQPLELDAAPTANNTGMLLLVNDGTTTTLKVVTIGAADSGGTGYRVLRVLN